MLYKHNYTKRPFEPKIGKDSSGLSFQTPSNTELMRPYNLDDAVENGVVHLIGDVLTSLNQSNNT